MAAYRRVYDKRHLQADCQELGSAHSWSYDRKFSHVKTPPLPAIYPVSKIKMGSLVITILLPLAVWPRGIKCSELKGYALVTTILLSGNNPGQVVGIQVPLSASSITRYQSHGSSALQLER